MSNTEYVTVFGRTPAELDRAVNEKLRQGYVLYGNPYVTREADVLLCQAMTRENKGAVRVG